MLFIAHRKSIVDQRIKFIFPNLFIAYKNSSMKLWKIDIEPPIVFGLFVKKSTILNYIGINRIFKRIRISRLVKESILLFGKINFIISSFFVNCIIGVTAVSYTHLTLPTSDLV